MDIGNILPRDLVLRFHIPNLQELTGSMGLSGDLPDRCPLYRLSVISDSDAAQRFRGPMHQVEVVSIDLKGCDFGMEL